MTGLSQNDQRAISFLHRNGGTDLQQLCEALGVTRTAVRQRMSRLQRDGLVESEEVGSGRGRPKSVFRLTDLGRSALGEDYRSVAVALWQTILALPESETKTTLLADFRRRLVEQLGVRRSDDQLESLVQNMQSAGFNVEADKSETLPILRENNCPFPALAEHDDTICEMEREIVSEITGVPVEFKNRCQDGHHCCEFELQLQESK